MKKGFLKFLISFNLFIICFLVFDYLQPRDLDLSGRYVLSDTAVYHGQKIKVPEYQDDRTKKSVLGQISGPKKIFIDLTNQMLYAFEGNHRVFNFPVSTGKWGRTPTGVFNIWIKLRYTKMEGGSRALNTYYYLPNVPYVMFFYNRQVPRYHGYGIHGTYWHNNFGHPMSHGCINMKTSEAAKLYYWADPDLGGRSSIYATKDNPGTQVVIFGKAPNY